MILLSDIANHHLFLSLYTYTPVHASLITVEDQGQLIGFDGISLNNETFNVRFVEGSFISIFGDASGLDFITFQDAGDAAQALWNSFNTFPLFDSQTSLTYGLTSDISGQIFTPWNYFPSGQIVQSRNFKNAGIQDQFDTIVTVSSMLATYDTSSGNNFSGARVWADWSIVTSQPTPAPEPSILALMGLGVIDLGLGSSRRKMKK